MRIIFLYNRNISFYCFYLIFNLMYTITQTVYCSNNINIKRCSVVVDSSSYKSSSVVLLDMITCNIHIITIFIMALPHKNQPSIIYCISSLSSLTSSDHCILDTVPFLTKNILSASSCKDRSCVTIIIVLY